MVPPMGWFERLSGLDATFLYWEDRSAHMHVGSVLVFEGTPPAYEDIVRLIESRLDRVPRYRQRLETVRFGQGRPVWVDDDKFDVHYHIRHTALPAPGGQARLSQLAGRLFSQQLDRGKPLWELWFIEGLGDNRFAILSKTHHCMIDGISGVDIGTVLMDAQPGDGKPPASVPTWQPRPAPTRRELLRASLVDQIRNPIQAVRDAASPDSPARRSLGEFLVGMRPLAGLARMGQAPECSLNPTIGPHRRFEMVELSLPDAKKVRATFGCTINDVMLTVVTAALRSFLLERGDPSLGPDLRAMVPVSVRAKEQRGTLGNQVTAVFCPLPVGTADPLERLRKIGGTMRGIKDSRQAVGALALTRLSDFSPATLVAQAARLQSRSRFFNLLITNVPGPQFPLYLLGRELLGCYPAVPLVPTSAVAVALLSYNNRFGIGLTADADHMRDVARLGEHLRAGMAELVELANTEHAAAPAAS